MSVVRYQPRWRTLLRTRQFTLLLVTRPRCEPSQETAPTEAVTDAK